MNKYRRLLQDIIVFGLGNFIVKIIQFLLMPLYTTYLTAEIYGIAELVNNLTELLYPVVTICIFEAVFRFTVDDERNGIVFFSVGFKFFIRSFVYIAGLAGCIYFIKRNNLVLLLFFVLYSYSFRMLLAFYTRGLGESKRFAISGIVNAIALVIFSIIFIVNLKMGAAGYLLGIGMAHCASAVCLLFGKHYWRNISYKNKEYERQMKQYSLPLILYNEIYWLQSMAGRFILSFFFDTATAGIYMAVNKIAAVINMFQQVFYYAFQLNNSRESKEGDILYYTRVFFLFSALMIIGSSFVLLCIPFTATFILKNDFSDGITYLPMIIYTAVIDCIFCFFKSLYTAYKDTKRTINAVLLGGIVNVVLLLLLVPQNAIWGVIFSLSVSNIVMAIYRVLDTRRYIHIKINWCVQIIELLLLFTQAICITFVESVGYRTAVFLFGVLMILILFQSKKIWGRENNETRHL